MDTSNIYKEQNDLINLIEERNNLLFMLKSVGDMNPEDKKIIDFDLNVEIDCRGDSINTISINNIDLYIALYPDLVRIIKSMVETINIKIDNTICMLREEINKKVTNNIRRN